MVKYDKDVIKAFKQSEKEMYESNNSVVTVNHFILSTLKLDNKIKKIFNKYNIDYKKYKDKIIKKSKKINNTPVFYSLELKKILDLSYDTANRYQSNEIKLEHIFITLIDEETGISILKELNLNIELFYKDLLNLLNKSNEIIFDIGINLTELAKSNKLPNIVGRDKEIKQVIEILARKNKNNPILIGEAGVGKTAIVEELANLISSNSVPAFLKNKKIVSINISSIISGTKYRGEFEEKLNKILKECENRNDIILFVDEIHTIVGAGGAEGAIDASNILKPSLARGTIKLIGATTINEYKKTIAIDKALDRRFQKVMVNIPSKEETYSILKSIKKEYEEFHNVKISDEMLKKIIVLSDKYVLDRNNPDKSIDILDEACANTNVIRDCKSIEKLNVKLQNTIINKKESIKNNDYKKAFALKEKEQKLLSEIKSNITSKKDVNIKTIIEIIESKCNSKIYDIETNKIYEYLKDKLNNRIIGQEDSINDIICKLRILNNKNDDLPISILIDGSSGVGKTYFATEFSKLTNRNLIKLNMSDYQSDISISRIIGSPQGYVGYNDNNTVFEELKLNPNSIILIDDIEKGNKQVVDLFAKVLEEGVIKNSKNELINFKNTIIIITSKKNSYKSIGYINKIQKSEDNLKDFHDKVTFRIYFKELNKNDIKKIVELYLKDFNDNYNVNIKLTSKEIDNIVNKSSYKECGAKNIKSILKNHLEDLLISTTTL